LFCLPRYLPFLFLYCPWFGYSSYNRIQYSFSWFKLSLAYFVDCGFSLSVYFLGMVKRSAFALGFLLVWNIIEFNGVLSFKYSRSPTTAASIHSIFFGIYQIWWWNLLRLSVVKIWVSKLVGQHQETWYVDLTTIIIM
jgi:hypothetical protein